MIDVRLEDISFGHDVFDFVAFQYLGLSEYFHGVDFVFVFVTDKVDPSEASLSNGFQEVEMVGTEAEIGVVFSGKVNGVLKKKHVLKLSSLKTRTRDHKLNNQ